MIQSWLGIRGTLYKVVPYTFTVNMDLCSMVRRRCMNCMSEAIRSVVKGKRVCGGDTNQTTQCSYPNHSDAVVELLRIPI
jgi:hypothetical protein